MIDEIAVAKTARLVPIPDEPLSPDRETVAFWHFNGPRKSAFADSSQFRTHNLVPVHVNTGPYAVEAAGKLAVSWGHIKVR